MQLSALATQKRTKGRGEKKKTNMGFIQPITNAIGVTKTLNTKPRKQYFQHNSRRYPKSTKLSVEGCGIFFSA